MNQSLDEIIRRKRATKPTRGRGRGGNQQSAGRRPRSFNTSPSRRGMVTKRGGRGVSRGRITDARLKIIEKKRRGIVDARYQLAQIAKQTDARNKLIQLRSKRNISSTGLPSRKFRGRQQGSGITRQNWVVDKRQGSRRIPGLFRNTRDLDAVDVLYEDEDDDYVDLIEQHVRSLPMRTINSGASSNVAQLLSGGRAAAGAVPPLLRVKVPLTDADYGESYYDDYQDEEDEAMDTEDLPTRTLTASPTAPRPIPVITQKKTIGAVSAMRQDWPFSKKGNLMESGSEIAGTSSKLMQSRLDLSARAGFAQPPAISNGFKVIVSNLQTSVTEEDIKELFGDVGPMNQWRLLRPGTAEIIYKSRMHALSAVDVYHKRQLDGQPMNVVHVPQPAATADTKSVASRSPAGNKLKVQPDIGIIHKALFKL